MEQANPDKEEIPEGPEGLIGQLRWILAGLGMSGIKDWPTRPAKASPLLTDPTLDALGPEPPIPQDAAPASSPEGVFNPEGLSTSPPFSKEGLGGIFDRPSASEPASDLRLPPEQALLEIREKMGDCKRCRLHSGRTNLVFADGSVEARLVFVGEGPGFDEDKQGLPFVGKAGKLLDKMIKSIGFKRPDVYICNVVKCRPPGNRTPSPDEIEACSPFMFEQIQTLRPRAICALGACAAQTLLGTTNAISRLRGRIHRWRGIPLVCTFHPAYLLRNPAQKAATWQDLLLVFDLLREESER